MSGFYSQTGIQLAQQGRKPEALGYLRHAVLTETVNAEVWLWLAHVTPDMREYQNCVVQALRLQPDHATALRMQANLDFRAQGRPVVAPTQEIGRLENAFRRQRRWRRWLILLNALLLLAVGVRVAVLLAENISADDLRTWLPFFDDTRRIQFTVGDEAGALSFQVEVPRSWYLADEGSPAGGPCAISCRPNFHRSPAPPPCGASFR
ncbi:MAG: hypothetical protein HC915_05950 [Anaerolineae bacterium]|nr:hypothetical protein [Anaerolineae bacterium]